MNRLNLNFIPLHAALLLLLAVAAHGQRPQERPLAKGYTAFNTIRTRNVFDPERRPILTGREQQNRDRRPSGRTRENFITVTGTMVSGDSKLAFFSGSRSEFSKVIGVHDKIADFTIMAITAEKVELERGGATFSVVVGSQIPLNGSSAAGSTPIPDDEAPESAEPAPASGTTGTTTSQPITTPANNTGSPASPAAGAPPAGDKAELLRRMMERRKKEI